MADAKLEELTRSFFEKVINQKNLAYIDEIIAPDFVEHEELEPGISGRESMKAYMGMLLGAFPDLHAQIEEMISDGKAVVVRSTWSGTHLGEFMGIPTTGKKVEYGVIDILKFSGNTVSEHWGISQDMKMMSQLGLMPGME